MTRNQIGLSAFSKWIELKFIEGHEYAIDINPKLGMHRIEGGSLVHAIFREGVRTPLLWLQGYVPSPFYEREELEKRLLLASKAPSEKIITFFRISNKFQDNGILKLILTGTKILEL